MTVIHVASGDLRHVVKSVNGLPDNYPGNLKILLNDYNHPVVARNIVLLLILGTISDTKLAADVALHFWYSVFMPAEYSVEITRMLVDFVKKPEPRVQPLGNTSQMHVNVAHPKTEDLDDTFRHYLSPTSFTIDMAQEEYDRVRNAPSREDFRDRMYSRLKASHRLAFKEFRRFGIVLPFGAPNAHFNRPNKSLFRDNGLWWQTDFADPLEGWE